MKHPYDNPRRQFPTGGGRTFLVTLVLIIVLVGCQGTSAPQTSSSESPPDGAVPASGSVQDPMALPTAVPVTDALVVPDAVPEDLATAWEVWNLLVERHVDRGTFDREEFDEGAIRGILATLGDIHTNYVPPEAFEVENQDLYGSFQGIGARVEMNADGKLFIVAPFDGSPAKRAGLRAGDLILEVNGESIAGLSIMEAVNKIRGPKGSEVRLLIRHLGGVDDIEVVVLRDEIALPSVSVRTRPNDRISHIRLSTFYADTPQDLAAEIRKEQASGAEGLILDVRDNPGGLLGSVVDVVSMFIDDGDLILYELDGAGRRSDHKARGAGAFKDIPLVILTNEGSASASEIVAGALQDHGRAPIVGAKTFGKGSVNMLRRLSNGGGLFLTFAKWYTPNGKLIEGNGIEPDHEVTSRDRRRAEVAQFEKAVEVMEGLLASRSASAGGA